MSGAHKFEASDLAKFHSIPHIRPRLVERVRVCRIEHCIRTTDNQRAVCTELQPGGPRRSSRYCWRNPTLSRNTCSSYSGTGKILSTSPYVETSKAKSPSPLSAQESSPPCWKIRSQQTLGMFKKKFNRVLKYFKAGVQSAVQTKCLTVRVTLEWRRDVCQHRAPVEPGLPRAPLFVPRFSAHRQRPTTSLSPCACPLAPLTCSACRMAPVGSMPSSPFRGAASAGTQRSTVSSWCASRCRVRGSCAVSRALRACLPGLRAHAAVFVDACSGHVVSCYA